MKFYLPFLFFALSTLHAESLDSLLSGYLENDLQLQKFVLTAESKVLSLKSTKIQNGIDVTLSTGTVKIQSSSDGNRRITLTPNAKVEIASADVSLEANVPIKINDGEREISDGSISATVGILSNNRKKRRVSLLEAERALLEAERNVKNRAISAEKEFFTSLKSLYKYAGDVLDANEDLFDDETALRVLIAQGYSKNSASFRQANLKVERDKRNVQEKQRIFTRQTEIFARKCGRTFNRGNVDEAQKSDEAFNLAVDFLPSEIPKATPEDIFSYDKNLFSESEQARWDSFIGELKRRTAGYDPTLSVTGDSFYDSGDESSDSAGGKINFSYRGVGASAGAYFPTNSRILGGDVFSDGKPYFLFSLTISPNDWRLTSIQKKQDVLSSRLEKIAEESALDSYENEITSKITEFNDIQWAERSYAHELETYSILEKDMARWLREGSVKESDWRSAKNNRDKARLNVLMNALDLLIFNDSVRLMFREKESKK